MRNVCHVFLIEDNAGDILLIRSILREQGIPIRVHVARDGAEAMFMLAEERFKPDLILLDLNLPRISGNWFLRRSKLEVPVVVFTSSTNQADIQEMTELGAKDLCKSRATFRSTRIEFHVSFSVGCSSQ